MLCEDCGFEAKSGAGLDRHRTAKHPRVEGGPVEQAVRRDLRAVVGAEGLKASAVKLAARLDEGASARDLPGLASELRQTLSDLGVTVSAEEQVDAVDQLAARRHARVTAAADTARTSEGE
jgi:hypothetical protein